MRVAGVFNLSNVVTGVAEAHALLGGNAGGPAVRIFATLVALALPPASEVVEKGFPFRPPVVVVDDSDGDASATVPNKLAPLVLAFVCLADPPR